MICTDYAGVICNYLYWLPVQWHEVTDSTVYALLCLSAAPSVSTPQHAKGMSPIAFASCKAARHFCMNFFRLWWFQLRIAAWVYLSLSVRTQVWQFRLSRLIPRDISSILALHFHCEVSCTCFAFLHPEVIKFSVWGSSSRGTLHESRAWSQGLLAWWCSALAHSSLLVVSANQ